MRVTSVLAVVNVASVVRDAVEEVQRGVGQLVVVVVTFGADWLVEDVNTVNGNTISDDSLVGFAVVLSSSLVTASNSHVVDSEDVLFFLIKSQLDLVRVVLTADSLIKSLCLISTLLAVSVAVDLGTELVLEPFLVLEADFLGFVQYRVVVAAV